MNNELYTITRSHPELIDLIVTQTRRELVRQEKEKFTSSVMEKLAIRPEEKGKIGKENDRSR